MASKTAAANGPSSDRTRRPGFRPKNSSRASRASELGRMFEGPWRPRSQDFMGSGQSQSAERFSAQDPVTVNPPSQQIKVIGLGEHETKCREQNRSRLARSMAPRPRHQAIKLLIALASGPLANWLAAAASRTRNPGLPFCGVTDRSARCSHPVRIGVIDHSVLFEQHALGQ